MEEMFGVLVRAPEEMETTLKIFPLTSDTPRVMMRSVGSTGPFNPSEVSYPAMVAVLLFESRLYRIPCESTLLEFNELTRVLLNH